MNSEMTGPFRRDNVLRCHTLSSMQAAQNDLRLAPITLLYTQMIYEQRLMHKKRLPTWAHIQGAKARSVNGKILYVLCIKI